MLGSGLKFSGSPRALEVVGHGGTQPLPLGLDIVALPGKKPACPGRPGKSRPGMTKPGLGGQDSGC